MQSSEEWRTSPSQECECQERECGRIGTSTGSSIAESYALTQPATNNMATITKRPESSGSCFGSRDRGKWRSPGCRFGTRTSMATIVESLESPGSCFGSWDSKWPSQQCFGIWTSTCGNECRAQDRWSHTGGHEDSADSAHQRNFFARQRSSDLEERQ